MKAIVIGATGATGRELVETLLGDGRYTAVSIFVRRSINIDHPKLIENIVDLSAAEQYAELIVGDVLFSCLGTTLKSAGSKDAQWAIDFDIPHEFATIAKGNGVHSMVLVSAYGADPQSRIFYSRMKGELERQIAELAFGQYIIFRPGMLLRPNTDRLGEKLTAILLRGLNAIGILRKQRPLPTAILAQKLAIAPAILPDGESLVELDRIFSF